VNESPASLRWRIGNRKGGGIYVEGEGEEDERDRNRWQVVQPKIWRQEFLRWWWVMTSLIKNA